MDSWHKGIGTIQKQEQRGILEKGHRPRTFRGLTGVALQGSVNKMNGHMVTKSYTEERSVNNPINESVSAINPSQNNCNQVELGAVSLYVKQ